MSPFGVPATPAPRTAKLPGGPRSLRWKLQDSFLKSKGVGWRAGEVRRLVEERFAGGESED